VLFAIAAGKTQTKEVNEPCRRRWTSGRQGSQRSSIPVKSVCKKLISDARGKFHAQARAGPEAQKRVLGILRGE